MNRETCNRKSLKKQKKQQNKFNTTMWCCIENNLEIWSPLMEESIAPKKILYEETEGAHGCQILKMWAVQELYVS